MDNIRAIGYVMFEDKIKNLSEDEVFSLIGLANKYGTMNINGLLDLYPNLERVGIDKKIEKITPEQLEGIFLYELIVEESNLTESEKVYLNSLLTIQYETVIDTKMQIAKFFSENTEKICLNGSNVYIGKKLKSGEKIFLGRESSTLKNSGVEGVPIMYKLDGNEITIVNYNEVYNKKDMQYKKISGDRTEIIDFFNNESIEKIEEAIDLELTSNEKSEKWIWAMMGQCKFYIENKMVDKIDKINEVKAYIIQYENKKNKGKIKSLEQGIKKLKSISKKQDNKSNINEKITESPEKIDEKNIEDKEIKEKSFIAPEADKLKELMEYCIKYDMSNVSVMSIFNQMINKKEYEEYLEEIIMYFEMYEKGEVSLEILRSELQKTAQKPVQNEIVYIKEDETKENEKNMKNTVKNTNNHIRQYPQELSALNRMKFILDNFEIEETLIGKHEDVKGRIFFKIKGEEYIIGETFFKEYKNKEAIESYGNSTWLIPKENLKYKEDKVEIEKQGIKRVNHGKNVYFRNLILRTQELFENPNKKLDRKEELVEANIEKIKKIREMDLLISKLKKTVEQDEVTRVNKEIKELEIGE